MTSRCFMPMYFLRPIGFWQHDAAEYTLASVQNFRPEKLISPSFCAGFPGSNVPSFVGSELRPVLWREVAVGQGSSIPLATFFADSDSFMDFSSAMTATAFSRDAFLLSRTWSTLTFEPPSLSWIWEPQRTHSGRNEVHTAGVLGFGKYLSYGFQHPQALTPKMSFTPFKSRHRNHHWKKLIQLVLSSFMPPPRLIDTRSMDPPY